MPKVHIVSFATRDFEEYRRELTASAAKFGFTSAISYDENYIKSTDFYRKHFQVFQAKRGYGYWLWKPFVVKEALSQVQDGDIIFYLDAASKFLMDPTPLIEICKISPTGMVAFDCNPLINAQWTKIATFKNLDCNTKEYWHRSHVIATAFLVTKNEFGISFIDEWLKECENYSSLIYNQEVETNAGLPEFIDHREDQSIFSLLIAKKGISVHRNPTYWGNYLKIQSQRVDNEYNGFPYQYTGTISGYSDRPYTNSDYGTLLEFNRKSRFDLSNQKESFASRLFSRISQIFKK